MDTEVLPAYGGSASLGTRLEAEAIQYLKDGESTPHAPSLPHSSDTILPKPSSTLVQLTYPHQSPRPAPLPQFGHFDPSVQQDSNASVRSLLAPDGPFLDMKGREEAETNVDEEAAETLSNGFYGRNCSHWTGEAPKVAAADIIAEGLGLCSILKLVLQPDDRASGDAFDATPRSSIGITLNGTAIASLCIGSPAYLSGQLEKGDIVTHIDGMLVDRNTIFAAVIGADVPGSKVDMTVNKKSGRMMKVALQRTSANEMMRKKRICELVQNLRQSAARWKDNTSSREVEDLDFEFQHVLADAYTAESNLAHHKSVHRQANHHLDNIQLLLSRLHALESQRHEPIGIDQTEDVSSSKTWRTCYMDLEDSFRETRARLVDAQVDLSQSQLREAEVRHDNDLLRKQIFNISSSSDHGAFQTVSSQQSTEMQELQAEVETLRAALAAAQAVDDENRATINDLTNMLESKSRAPSSLTSDKIDSRQLSAHGGRLSRDAQSADQKPEPLNWVQDLTGMNTEQLLSQVEVLRAERDSALQKWELSQLKVENLAQVLSSCHKTMATRDEAAHTQREYTVSLQEQLALAKQHVRTVSKDCLNLRNELAAGNSLIASLTTALEGIQIENGQLSKSAEAARRSGMRNADGKKRQVEEVQAELDELKRKCEILERTRAASDKKCKEMEVRAEQEADQVADIVENLRLSMEQQLDELREEHEKVLHERDTAESQLQMQLTGGNNSQKLSGVVDDVLACYDCMEKETVIGGKDAVIDELRQALENAEEELQSLRAAAAVARIEHDKIVEDKNQALQACSEAGKLRDHVQDKLSSALEESAGLRAELEKLKEEWSTLQDACLAPVTIKMVLDMNFASLGDENSAERMQFERDLISDLASASGAWKENFRVQKLSAGSVIVVADIHRSTGSNCVPTLVAKLLQTQAEQVDSPLRRGKLTCSLQDISVLRQSDTQELSSGAADLHAEEVKQLRQRVQDLESHLQRTEDLLSSARSEEHQAQKVQEWLQDVDACLKEAEKCAADTERLFVSLQKEVQDQVCGAHALTQAAQQAARDSNARLQNCQSQLEKAWLEREEAAEPAARQGRTQGRELDHDDDLYSATKKMSRVMRERDDIKAEMHRVQSELQRLRAAALESEAQVQTERESWKSNNLALSLRVDELSRKLAISEDRRQETKSQRDALQASMAESESKLVAVGLDLQALQHKYQDVVEAEAAKVARIKEAAEAKRALLEEQRLEVEKQKGEAVASLDYERGEFALRLQQALDEQARERENWAEQAQKDREKWAADLKKTREGLEAECNLMKMRMEIAEDMSREKCQELERTRAGHDAEIARMREDKARANEESRGGEEKESLEELRAKAKVMEEELIEVRLRATRLDEEKQSALADSKALRAVAAQMKEQHELMVAKNDANQMQMDSMQAELTSMARLHSTEIKEAKEASIVETDSLKKSVQDLTRQRDAALRRQDEVETLTQAENKRLQEDLVTNRTEMEVILKKSEQEKSRLTALLADSQGNLKATVLRADRLEAQIKKLQEEASERDTKAQEEQASHDKQVALLQDKSLEQRNELQSLRGRAMKRDQELSEKEDEIRDLASRIRVLEQQQPAIDEKLLKLKLASAEREGHVARDELDSCKCELASCQAELAGVRDKLKAAQTRADRLQEEHEKDLYNISSLSAKAEMERDEAMIEIKHLNDEAEANENRIRQMKAQSAQVLKERDEAREVAEKLHDKFSALLASNPDLRSPSA